MKQVVGLLGILWAIANLYVAYLFVVNSQAAKTAAKGVEQQGLLLVGGLAIAAFALLLGAQCVTLALARESRS